MNSDPYSGLLQAGNYVFTTEGHPLSVGHPALQRMLPVPISIIAGPAAVASHEISTHVRVSSGFFSSSSNELAASAGCGGAPEVSQITASRDSEPAPRHLQPSALDRRVCPEPLQVSQQPAPHFE